MSNGKEPTKDVEKYKNLLDEMNDYREREIKFQNEISKLRTQLKDKEIFQSGIDNIKDISKHFESDFIEEDDKDEKNVIDILSNVKKNQNKQKLRILEEDNFLNILNAVPK